MTDKKTEAKAETARKVLTTDEKLEAIIKLLEANGMSLPKELK